MANFTFSKLSSRVQELGNPAIMNLLCDLEQSETAADIISSLNSFDAVMQACPSEKDFW